MRFETAEDLANEREVAEKFAAISTGTKILKLPEFSLDYLFHRGGVALIVVEIKCFTSTFSEYKSQIVSMAKYSKMESFNQLIPVYFVCKYSCGTIAFIKFGDMRGDIRTSGRKPREGSTNDIEECMFVPRKYFKTIKQ